MVMSFIDHENHIKERASPVLWCQLQGHWILLELRVFYTLFGIKKQLVW